jgi:hypothetical protein
MHVCQGFERFPVTHWYVCAQLADDERVCNVNYGERVCNVNYGERVLCDGDGDDAVPVATVSTYAFAVESASGVRGHGVVFVRV